MYVPSPDLRGATASMLAPIEIDAIYLGEETINVRAGTFATKHFQYVDEGAGGSLTRHPPYDVWVTADADAIMVQGGVGGSMLSWYELIELGR